MLNLTFGAGGGKLLLLIVFHMRPGQGNCRTHLRKDAYGIVVSDVS